MTKNISISRKTKETSIDLSLNTSGSQQIDIPDGNASAVQNAGPHGLWQLRHRQDHDRQADGEPLPE